MNHTLFQTKMVEIDTLFQTKTAHTYIAYIRDYPHPGAKNALQIMSLAAYASETKIHKWLTYKVGHALQIDHIRKRVVIRQIFLSPSHRAPRALFFFLPSPPTTQRGLCGGESHCKKRSYSILVTRTLVCHLHITSFLGSNHFTMRLTTNNLMRFFEALEDLLVEH